jgi:enoyl-CoA hydratase/carnithine racemase
MKDKAYVVRKGRVGILYINRPEARNCIDDETAAALNRLFGELAEDEGIDVVILTGAGNKAFSSGLDLKQLARDGPTLIPRVMFQDTGWAGIARRKFPKPLIAAVNGFAIGGGLELVLSTDFAIASRNAKFGFTEVTLGTIADAGAGFRLPHWVPLPYAKEMLLTGRLIDAREAHRIGLVNRVVPSDWLMEVCIEVARGISRNSSSAMQLTKRLISETLNQAETRAWEINDKAMVASFATADFMEGARAFAEKRPPRFSRDRGALPGKSGKSRRR